MRQYKLSWIVKSSENEKTIKQFLVEKQISRRALTKIKFQGGSIKVNGIEKNVRYVLKFGDRLEVEFPEEAKNEQLTKENIPLDILYEDRDLLVVNKPPQMNTIPSREHPGGSIANALAYYYEQKGISAAVHIVTRLDRNTSGLLLVAKHRHAHHLCSILQQKNEIARSYEGVASGVFSKKEDVIDAPIGRKLSSIIEREVRDDGKRAVTKYEVLQQFHDAAHVKIWLETGRTHQIRVHFSYIGHPLLGDELYGGPTDLMKRQALHCSELRFFHPFLHKELHFNAPLPLDLKQVLHLLE
ncbi:RluA family pseudouridine synthase [Siminovitchia sp. FSL H7-0308]|uniref:Pseudouridine synthase n=1 Tax=Siminovitchia thermophila TaxID=1245522 RepID=A0ABS2RCG6_9BACI|nr:RluA family pseudouridine synthase [Siminovitchia thermophila]MBM7717351.1 23S rRNA pseudouridine1911/1915/1917 synthase [Siminovitchia thermophila]ONK24393.1 RNA pseudouridine synthase [Bacillus sp. VT-16-64]